MKPIFLKTAQICGKFLDRCEFIVCSTDVVVFIIDISDSMLVFHINLMHNNPPKKTDDLVDYTGLYYPLLQYSACN